MATAKKPITKATAKNMQEAPSKAKTRQNSIVAPDYHHITVKLVDGTTIETRSTWGKPRDILKLDIDCHSHPAWTGGEKHVDNAGQVAKFNQRFANFSISKK